MSLRVLLAFSTRSSLSPFADPLAANAAWLPAALNELGVEVAELITDDWNEVIGASAAFSPDVVHVHGLEPGELLPGPASLLFTDYTATGPAAAHIALSWRAAAGGSAAAVIAPAFDSAAAPTTRDPGDDLVLSFDGRDEHALASAIAVATAAERPLVLFAPPMDAVADLCRAAIEAGVASGWLHLAAAPNGTEIPSELLSAAAYLALGRGAFDMGALAAMSCGVPVVTLEGTPAAEIIVGGESGFVCSTLPDAARVLENLEDLSPALARSRARLLFDAATGARLHLDVYRALLSGKAAPAVHPEHEDRRPSAAFRDHTPATRRIVRETGGSAAAGAEDRR